MVSKAKLLIIIFLLLVSCKDLFSKKESKTTQEIFTYEPIDFSTIDAYSLLPECEDITNRDLQKECFYENISGRINDFLNTIETNTEIESVHSNLVVQLLINSDGKASVNKIDFSENANDSNKELDSLIRLGVEQLPELQPAIKSGIPINVVFLLPIVIK